MPQFRNRWTRWCIPACAGLLAGLVVLLGLVAVNHKFHAWLHTEDAVPHGVCSACVLAKGQVDSPAGLPRLVISSQVLFLTSICRDDLRPRPADFSVDSNRGPPASVSCL